MSQAPVYSEEFFSTLADEAYSAARTILPIVFKSLQPKNVIDIGCGIGTWMAAAQELGASPVLGVDGEWVKNIPQFRDQLDIRSHNLEQGLPSNLGTFDLAICLEVAEHLSEARGASLVSDVCKLSKNVLFSAAIPQQKGTQHINCQWQSYWVDLFSKHGRMAVDIVRPSIWERSEIPFWYKQNILLFVPNAFGMKRPAMIDVVHPDMHRSSEPSLKQAVGAVIPAFRRAFLRIASKYRS